MDLPAIAANIAAAIPLAKGWIDIRDGQKLAAVQADLTERLLNAQTHIAELLGMLTEKTLLAAELQERLRKLEGEQLERLRYELAEIAPGGDLAYRLKTVGALEEDNCEPMHFLCQPCLDVRGHKVVLVRGSRFGSETFTCPECSAEFTGRHVGM